MVFRRLDSAPESLSCLASGRTGIYTASQPVLLHMDTTLHKPTLLRLAFLRGEVSCAAIGSVCTGVELLIARSLQRSPKVDKSV